MTLKMQGKLRKAAGTCREGLEERATPARPVRAERHELCPRDHRTEGQLTSMHRACHKRSLFACTEVKLFVSVRKLAPCQLQPSPPQTALTCLSRSLHLPSS